MRTDASESDRTLRILNALVLQWISTRLNNDPSTFEILRLDLEQFLTSEHPLPGVEVDEKVRRSGLTAAAVQKRFENRCVPTERNQQ